MRIETDRLTIRPYHPSDVRDAFEIFSDREVMRHCEPPFSMQKTADMLQLFIDRGIAFAAVHRASGKVIGHLLFKQLPDAGNGIYEMGWMFNQQYWRQGYAHEAASALMAYGFQQLNLHKICAETIDPVKAVGLMQKLGMQQEGRLRKHTRNPEGDWTDLLWYAILREDWLAKQAQPAAEDL